jgi:hypothetical protein
MEAQKAIENLPSNSVPSSDVGARSLGNGTVKSVSRTRARSQATSGRRVFVDGDGNSRWARRYRDLIAAHCQDLGGVDLLSEAQLSLIRRASAIELELEQMEGKLSLGQQVDLDVFTRSASHLRRLFETLGIARQAKPVETLQEYLARKYPKQQAVEVAPADTVEAQ